MNQTLTYLLTRSLNYNKIITLVTKANQFESYILIEYENKKVNAKSILSTCILQGFKGVITIHAQGKDSNHAIEDLQKALID
ncbi:HPr family phosphocarrier protein [Bacillus alkalicellulosilyticus]|uniref:HPr family phosphocarrier protein n=1 Tax=Alkalihalobacterium alkalicellulosilyticum TaxID=1912214 RepID=UPI0009985511|nr:HPr family phosphocarrier protein [Bacillus alkalicellulosilyticus]